MNEPNGTLVMTTCKCRENTKNLVMTRTYFTEMLENKIAQGVEKEQQRIIQLLEKMDIEIHYTTWFDAQGNIMNSITSPQTLDREKIFALIKGEN